MFPPISPFTVPVFYFSITCINVHLCMNMYSWVHLPVEARRGRLFPWSWTYKWLCSLWRACEVGSDLRSSALYCLRCRASSLVLIRLSFPLTVCSWRWYSNAGFRCVFLFVFILYRALCVWHLIWRISRSFFVFNTLYIPSFLLLLGFPSYISFQDSWIFLSVLFGFVPSLCFLVESFLLLRIHAQCFPA